MATSAISGVPTLPRLQSGRLWRRWTLWCGLGELAGFGVVGLAALLLLRLVGEPRSGGERLLTWLGMVIGGAAEGSALAAAQWHVLHGRFPRLTLRAWWAPTVAAAMVGWGLGMLPSLLRPPTQDGAGGPPPPLLLAALLVAAGGALAGAMFGAFQALALRHHAPRAARWVPANALGWSVGMLWLFLGASLPDSSTPPLWVALSALGFGALGGLSVGALTGLTLVRLPGRSC